MPAHTVTNTSHFHTVLALILGVTGIAIILFVKKLRHSKLSKKEPTIGDLSIPTTQANNTNPHASIDTTHNTTPEINEDSSIQFSDKFLTFYMIASKDQKINGLELLEALQTNHLHFGPDRLFHRYETREGEGELLFSIAALSSTGCFDNQQMVLNDHKGICVFLDISKQSSNLAVFELLLNTLEAISNKLGALILDDQQQFLNDSALERYRQRLMRNQPETVGF